MKLLAAGLSFDKELQLPANFKAKGVKPDEDGQRYIGQFTLEIERARRALANSGAVDSDGHLTEFGQELERVPLDGTQAIAIMLADQSACVLEAALALTVLCEGRLNGKDKTILHVDKKWPTAWRIQAVRCHRAFAAGCTDDLDILLRVYSEWQKVRDNEEKRNEWCATWWVNHNVLEQVEDEVNDLIRSLTGKVKRDVKRHMNLSLAGRVRAVISRALGGLCYEFAEDQDQAEDPQYHNKDAGYAVLSGSTLVDPGEKIVALGGFRPSPDQNGEKKKPFISNVVRFLDWASESDSEIDPSDMGFELILKSTGYLRDQDGGLKATDDVAKELRKEFPVGTFADITWGPGKTVSNIEVVHKPFTYDISSKEAPKAKQGTMVPTEAPEVAELVDTAEEEKNDDTEGDEGGAGEGEKAQSVSLNLLVSSQYAYFDLKKTKTKRVEVVGYEPTGEDGVVLVVGPVEDDAVPKDPAVHDDLEYGDTVEVEVRGLVQDATYPYCHLARTDGKGSFYLQCNTSGLDFFDREFVQWLRPGARLKPLVIPGRRSDKYSVTFLPQAYEHLAKAPTVEREGTGFYPGTIVKGIDEYHNVLVELDHRDEEKGFVYTFQTNIPSREEVLLGTEKGQRILVSLAWEKEKTNKGKVLKRKILDLPSGVSADDLFTISNVCEKYLSRYDKSSKRVIIDKRRQGGLPSDVAHHLIEMKSDDDVQWQKQVWAFYSGSFHQTVEATFTGNPYVVLRLPPDTTGDVIGPRWSEIKRLRDGQGVISVDFHDEEKTEVVVIGETVAAVNNTVNEINKLIRPVIGEMVVPDGKNGGIIGTGGENINSMCEATGCKTENDDCNWSIRGCTENAVLEFFEMAERHVSGTIGEIVSIGTLEIIEDATEAIEEAPQETSRPKLPNPFEPQDKPIYPVEGRVVSAVRKRVVDISKQEGASGIQATPVSDSWKIANNTHLTDAYSTWPPNSWATLDDTNSTSDKISLIAPLEEEAVRKENHSGKPVPEKSNTQSASTRIRIYELAKKLGIKSKDLADKLIAQGYPIKGYASTVDTYTAAEISRMFLSQDNYEIREKNVRMGTERYITLSNAHITFFPNSNLTPHKVEHCESLEGKIAAQEGSCNISISSKPNIAGRRVRIYELAKELGLRSTYLAERLIALGFPIKGYSSTVSSEEAADIRELLLNQGKAVVTDDDGQIIKNTTLTQKKVPPTGQEVHHNSGEFIRKCGTCKFGSSNKKSSTWGVICEKVNRVFYKDDHCDYWELKVGSPTGRPPPPTESKNVQMVGNKKSAANIYPSDSIATIEKRKKELERRKKELRIKYRDEINKIKNKLTNSSFMDGPWGRILIFVVVLSMSAGFIYLLSIVQSAIPERP